MIGYWKVLPVLVLTAMLTAHAQGDANQTATNSRSWTPVAPLADDSPALHARDSRAFHFGPFINYGNGLSDRSDFRFLSAGVEGGKALTPVLHAGPLSGQFELAANIMPVWSAFTPAPHTETRTCIGEGGTTVPCELPVGGGNYFGASITPVIFRWKFATPWKAVQPWLQGQGGVVYTTHKFPAGCTGYPRHGGRNLGVELHFRSGSGNALVHPPPAFR